MKKETILKEIDDLKSGTICFKGEYCSFCGNTDYKNVYVIHKTKKTIFNFFKKGHLNICLNCVKKRKIPKHYFPCGCGG